MNNYVFVVIVLAAWLGCVSYIYADDAAECKFWHQLSKNLSNAGDLSGDLLHMSCNSSCNDIRCTGHFKQSDMLFGPGVDLNFCFGVRLNHCVRPPSMSYYLDVPAQSIHKSGQVSHNDSFEVAGPTYKGSDSKIVILVEMQPVNASYILFGIEANLKLLVEGIPLFQHTEKIFPPTLIDIPYCNQTSKTILPYQEPPKCVPLPPPTGTPQPTTPKTVIIKSDTYNKSCELGLVVGQCSPNEMCVNAHGNSLARGGVCRCDDVSALNMNTGYCQAKGSKAVTATIPVPSVTDSSKQGPSKNKEDAKQGMNTTGIIIGGVAGGLLLIVVVVSIIIFIGRRKRMAIYRDRHQLLTDETDDIDSNVVV